jgi:hypothetical protein
MHNASARCAVRPPGRLPDCVERGRGVGKLLPERVDAAGLGPRLAADGIETVVVIRTQQDGICAVQAYPPGLRAPGH